jgi:hypothetical protein
VTNPPVLNNVAISTVNAGFLIGRNSEEIVDARDANDSAESRFAVDVEDDCITQPYVEGLQRLQRSRCCVLRNIQSFAIDDSVQRHAYVVAEDAIPRTGLTRCVQSMTGTARKELHLVFCHCLGALILRAEGHFIFLVIHSIHSNLHASRSIGISSIRHLRILARYGRHSNGWCVRNRSARYE